MHRCGCREAMWRNVFVIWKKTTKPEPVSDFCLFSWFSVLNFLSSSGMEFRELWVLRCLEELGQWSMWYCAEIFRISSFSKFHVLAYFLAKETLREVCRLQNCSFFSVALLFLFQNEFWWTNFHMEMRLIYKQRTRKNLTNFHVKDWAPRLILKQRWKQLWNDLFNSELE